QETDYVMLDEPLNNLDIAHSVEMMRHLKGAVEQLGRTIIVVLPDINYAARYAEYVCAVKDGQIVAFGAPEEIMGEEVLTPIFNTRIQVIDGPGGLLACYHECKIDSLQCPLPQWLRALCILQSTSNRLQKRRNAPLHAKI